MVQASFRQVFVLCPHGVTGGPEALHQLVHTINRLSGTARIAYVEGGLSWSLSHEVLRAWPERPAAVQSAYAHYDAPPLASGVLNEDTLVVVPEVWPEIAARIVHETRAHVAMWWLSVNNAPFFSQPGDHQTLLATLRSPRVHHLYQSHHALAYIQSLNLPRPVPLFDYTSDVIIRYAQSLVPADAAARRAPYAIAYYPAKTPPAAHAFIQNFKARHPDIEFLPIVNMTAAIIAQALGRSSIFIDFGDAPGKDRMPREAAAAGAVVLLRHVGAATHYLDWPIDQRFKFDAEELADGRLDAKIIDALENRAAAMAAQSYLRSIIFSEQEEFRLQVRRFFWGP